MAFGTFPRWKCCSRFNVKRCSVCDQGSICDSRILIKTVRWQYAVKLFENVELISLRIYDVTMYVSSIIKFLNEGAYAQIAITGKGFYPSTMRSFSLLGSHIGKLGVTEGINIFFALLGVLSITVIVALATYFSVLYIPYYQDRIHNAFSITVVATIIAFIISVIYLSMIDVVAAAVMQCYLVDIQVNNGVEKYGSIQMKKVLSEQEKEIK